MMQPKGMCFFGCRVVSFDEMSDAGASRDLGLVGSLVPFRFSWRTVSLSRTLKLLAGRALRPFCWQNNFSEKQRPKMQTASVPWSVCYFEMLVVCWSTVTVPWYTVVSIIRRHRHIYFYPYLWLFSSSTCDLFVDFSSSTAFLDDDTPLIFDDLRCSSNLQTHQHHQKLAKLYAFTILYLLFGLLGC